MFCNSGGKTNYSVIVSLFRRHCDMLEGNLGRVSPRRQIFIYLSKSGAKYKLNCLIFKLATSLLETQHVGNCINFNPFILENGKCYFSPKFSYADAYDVMTLLKLQR